VVVCAVRLLRSASNESTLASNVRIKGRGLNGPGSALDRAMSFSDSPARKSLELYPCCEV
jgi:hypothetical protein